MQSHSAKQIFCVFTMQFALTIVLAIALLMIGSAESLSGLAGGLAATIANALFAAVVFRRYKQQEPGVLLGSYYSAEFAKMALTALIFFVAIMYIESLSIIAMLGVYLVVHLASAFFVITLEHKKN
ncbi:MAG: ATP synthase subunit I [Gammaproteobacteria bacterium]